jgi:2,4-dienoyl-CoA reductase-like NADH-dependent reductase (Old Yellow Enzyme family)
LTSLLLSPLRLAGLELASRIVVAPMCQYVAEHGSATDWHLVHLGSLAMGGFALVIVEATHVSPQARITPGCLGLWSDENERALGRVVAFCRRHGTARLGIQLAHAGRKGSARVPLAGGTPLPPEEGAWETVAPSALAYAEGWHVPRAADRGDLARIRRDFQDAARRAARLGFDVVELHMAHGYLLHEFLSPLANRREDAYGGGFAGRTRFPLEVFDAVREVWPAERPLGVRLSATDWVEGGWTVAETVELVGLLKTRGCGFADISSGGLDPRQKLTVEPGYQVPFARAVRAATGIATMAVGMILTPHQAEAILAEGAADLVALARAAMDDPRWGWHAARALGAEIAYPDQYARAHPARWPGAALLRSAVDVPADQLPGPSPRGRRPT